MPKFKGFTLIELLIAVSIIAILASVGLLAYGSYIKSARDSRRQADLKTIQSALEQFFADQLYYPGFNSACAASYISIPNTTGCSLTNSTGTKKYMNVVPADPLSSPQPQYSYAALPSGCDNNSSNNKCNNYCLYTKLESPPSPAPTAPSGCSFPTGYNYGVTQP